MKCKIMLIDDVSISNTIMEKIIKLSSCDVEIWNYTDPQLAYEELDKINPDLIFLDLNMPIMNGWEYLDLMKKEHKKQKVVVLTSSISMVDKQAAFNYANVIDFCEKPVNKNRIAYYLEHAKGLAEC